MNTQTIKLSMAAALALALAACGGGGGDGNTSASNGTPTTSGTAAIGAPIADGTVEFNCASGREVTTTDAGGHYTITVPTASFPCLITVRAPSLSGSLGSLALMPGTANITPLTDFTLGIMSAQSPQLWSDPGALRTMLTQQLLDAAQNQLPLALGGLPGLSSMPLGWNPLTTPFSAMPGDPMDDYLENLGTSLLAANLSQSSAKEILSQGDELTQEVHALTAFTTPFAVFPAGWSKNLDSTYKLSIPDPIHGHLTANLELSGSGELQLQSGSPFTGMVSLLDNSAGTLCVAGQGHNNSDQHSQYIYLSSDFKQITDRTEIQNALQSSIGKTLTEYEDCAARDSTIEIDSGGNAAVVDSHNELTSIDLNSFDPQGTEVSYNGGTTIQRTQLYKKGSVYAVVFVSSDKNGSTNYDRSKDWNNIILSFINLPR